MSAILKTHFFLWHFIFIFTTACLYVNIFLLNFSINFLLHFNLSSNSPLYMYQYRPFWNRYKAYIKHKLNRFLGWPIAVNNAPGQNLYRPKKNSRCYRVKHMFRNFWVRRNPYGTVIKMNLCVTIKKISNMSLSTQQRGTWCNWKSDVFLWVNILYVL